MAPARYDMVSAGTQRLVTKLYPVVRGAANVASNVAGFASDMMVEMTTDLRRAYQRNGEASGQARTLNPAEPETAGAERWLAQYENGHYASIPYYPLAKMCDQKTGELWCQDTLGSGDPTWLSVVAKYQTLRRMRLELSDMPSQYIAGGIDTDDAKIAVPLQPPAIAVCSLSDKIINVAVVASDGKIYDKQRLAVELANNPAISHDDPRRTFQSFPELTERVATYKRKAAAYYAHTFREAYLRDYDSSPFCSRNPFSTMWWKLWWNPELSFAEMRSYAEANPGTRSAKVLSRMTSKP